MNVERTRVKRGFVDIKEGQVHYRYKGAPETIPLVMLHPGPTSSHSIMPLIDLLGESRFVVAPDMLGMGDSIGPEPIDPSMDYFAEAMFRVMDALRIDRCDLWGCMTGAACGIEMALQEPERVNRLYIELLQFYDPETQLLLEEGHAPAVTLDQIGSQLNLFWHLARDQHLFFPWFVRDNKHARAGGLPTPRQLHEKTVELLKAAETYHYALNAALKYPTSERLSGVVVPVIGPESFKEYLPGVVVREDFCVSPSTSPSERVAASAREILRHLA